MSAPHPKPDGKDNIGITLSLDYVFVNDEEGEDHDLPGVLIIWDVQSIRKVQ